MPVQDRSCLLQDIWHIIDVVYTQRSKSDDFPVTSDGHSPTKDTGYPLEESLDGGVKERISWSQRGGKKKKKENLDHMIGRLRFWFLLPNIPNIYLERVCRAV